MPDVDCRRTRRTVRSRPLAVASLVLAVACGGSDAPSISQPPSPPPPPPPPATGCAATSVGLTPINDLTGTYLGQPGGLYPGGNARPPLHESAGLALARAVGPLAPNGTPNAAGRYAMVSIGMSNTTQEFVVFKQFADTNALKDTRLVVVDGAQGGMVASDWANAGCNCWSVLNQRLTQAGVTANQVAVVWVKLSEGQPQGIWPGELLQLKTNVSTVLQRLRTRMPNLRLAYLSSRIYAGYAVTSLNPEPFAYRTGFAMRWVIEDQLNGVPGLNYDPLRGAVTAPWVAWGPYLWADGLRTRSDGLTWACSDMEADGTHPSTTGERKVAQLLLDFVRQDATAREWFLAVP